MELFLRSPAPGMFVVRLAEISQRQPDETCPTDQGGPRSELQSGGAALRRWDKLAPFV